MAKKNDASVKKTKTKPTASDKSSAKNKKAESSAAVKIRNEVLAVLLFMLAIFIFIITTRFQGVPEDITFIGVAGTYA